MSFLTQIVSVAWLSVRTIRQRLGSSAVAVVGIAGVVIVFVAVLSIAEGFQAAMKNAGQPDRALIMRGGASDEMSSGLDGEAVEVMKQAPGIRRENNVPLASTELYVIVDLPKRSTMTSANVPLRGIVPATPQVRYDARIVQGRMLNFGTNEVIAGRGAAAQFAGLSVGALVKTGQVTWTVVGIFESGGSVVGVRDLGRRPHRAGRVPPQQQLPVGAGPARVAGPVHGDEELADDQPAAQRQRGGRVGLLQRALVEHDVADPDRRLRHRRADGGRGRVRRDPDDVHRRLDADARDRDAARPRLQHDLGRDLGAGRIAGARRPSAAWPAACSPTSRSTATRRRR